MITFWSSSSLNVPGDPSVLSASALLARGLESGTGLSVYYNCWFELSWLTLDCKLHSQAENVSISIEQFAAQGWHGFGTQQMLEA